MIPLDVDYLRPDSLVEAVEAWRHSPESSLYYGGGTEIVTGLRAGTYKAGLLIDLKAIPELRASAMSGPNIFFGAALTLSEIADMPDFPLLAETARGVADRTVRNRLTLGGNVAGRLPWREALLPFLAADGLARIAGPAPDGGLALREMPLRALHDKRLKLGAGEFIVGLLVSPEAAAAPWRRQRFEGGSRVDYPLVSLAAIALVKGVAVAASGAFDHPAWAEGAPGQLTEAWRIESAFPRFRSDHRGTADYRAFLFRRALAKIREELA